MYSFKFKQHKTLALKLEDEHGRKPKMGPIGEDDKDSDRLFLDTDNAKKKK